MTWDAKPETKLRNEIRDALRRMGLFVETNSQRGRTYHTGLSKGSADLLLCVRGRMVALEVKTETGKQSAEQIAWGEWLTSHGGYYAVVRSVAEAIEAVRKAGRVAA